MKGLPMGFVPLIVTIPSSILPSKYFLNILKYYDGHGKQARTTLSLKHHHP
jgi:hypothetical protein